MKGRHTEEGTTAGSQPIGARNEEKKRGHLSGVQPAVGEGDLVCALSREGGAAEERDPRNVHPCEHLDHPRHGLVATSQRDHGIRGVPVTHSVHGEPNQSAGRRSATESQAQSLTATIVQDLLAILRYSIQFGESRKGATWRAVKKDNGDLWVICG